MPPRGRIAPGPSLAQNLEPVVVETATAGTPMADTPMADTPTAGTPMADTAMERAREDLAEREYLHLIRWAVRKAPELMRVLRIAYLFGQDAATPEEKAAGAAGFRLFRYSTRPPTSRVQPASERLEDIEREHISRVLRESSSVVEAARKLGINYSTLWRKRKRYRL
jgi:DNA-binding NtrC family response regulator